MDVSKAVLPNMWPTTLEAADMAVRSYLSHTLGLRRERIPNAKVLHAGMHHVLFAFAVPVQNGPDCQRFPRIHRQGSRQKIGPGSRSSWPGSELECR